MGFILKQERVIFYGILIYKGGTKRIKNKFSLGAAAGLFNSLRIFIFLQVSTY